MLVGMVPATAVAATIATPKGMTLDTQKETVLAPGVTQYEVVAYNSLGQRVEIWISETDLSVDTVEIYANYCNNDGSVLGMQKTTDQAAAFEENHPGKTVVAAINASYYDMSNGAPRGAFYMEGVDYSSGPQAYSFFAILKDGTAIIADGHEYETYKDQIKEAVGGEIHLVRDGEVCGGLGNYGDLSGLYPRQTIGVTADGRVFTMTADGYQAPITSGTTLQDQAEIMKALGCVEAIHLDGGGSSAYCARPAGSDTLQVLSKPGNGSERAVSNSLVIASTVVASNEFYRAVLAAEHEYVTPGATVALTAAGVSSSGAAVDIPAGASLRTKDKSMGYVKDGKYVAASGYTGDAVIQMVLNGEVVGETTVHVVIPTSLQFKQETIAVTYGNSYSLELMATVNGVNEVVLQSGDVTFTVSDTKLGSVNNGVFTAGAKNSGVTSGTITAHVAGNKNVSAVLRVALTELPDQPVIVADFEDRVPLTVEANTSQLELAYGIVDRTNGKVHSGSYAFKFGFDPNKTNALIALDGTYAGPALGAVSGYTADTANGETFADVDLAGAKTIGLWLYIPEDSQITYPVWQLKGPSGVETVPAMYEYGYAATEAGHTGWQYIAMSPEVMDRYNDGGYSIAALSFNSCTKNDGLIAGTVQNAYGYDRNEHQSVAGYQEFYIDDITIEYVNTAIDRNDPVFDYICMSYAGAEDVAVAGQTIGSNRVSFTAKATDASALNAASAKAYIDGNQITAGFTCSAAGTMTVEEMTLADGVHRITFVIEDVHGNCDYMTREFTVAANAGIPTVTVQGSASNAPDRKVQLGSVFWLEVKADEIEKIDTLTMVVNLNATSGWELEHMELAYGFLAASTVDKSSNSAKITITRTGNVEAHGTAVIARLPIRVWDYKNLSDACKPIDISAGAFAPVDIKVRLDQGLVTYDDGTKTSFSMQSVDVDSEIYNWYDVMQADGKGSGTTHIHAAAPVSDQVTTCTKNGYTGRTVCADCGSVVTWGTVIPALDHSFSEVAGKMVCTRVTAGTTCGRLLSGVHAGKWYKDGELRHGWENDIYYANGVKLTGVAAVDGIYYDFGSNGISKGAYTGLFLDQSVGQYRYAIGGALQSGWCMVGENWHYFGNDYNAVVGKRELFAGIVYEFEENGKLVAGVWHNDGVGTRYYYGPAYYKQGTAYYATACWQTIDGEKYCFDKDGYRYEGKRYVKEANAGQLDWYDFGTTGAAKKITGSGTISYDGGLYFMDEGTTTYLGLFQYRNDYYYSNSKYLLATGSYSVTKTNDLLPKGSYMFHADGRMYQGVEDGSYYVDGRVVKDAGLVYDTEKRAYYYIKSNGQPAIGTVEISEGKTNGLMSAGVYSFGENGQMIRAKEGLVVEADGVYYYENGVPTHKGLIYDETEGCYYYIRTNGQAATGEYTIYNSRTNGLLPAGTYDFGSDGKLFVENSSKNGLIRENGAVYYYENGQLVHKGLIYDEAEGCYYYIRTNGQAATGEYTIYNSRCNGLLPAGTYDFGSDGKLFVENSSKNGLIRENGAVYYYENGQLVHKGLIYDEAEGCYYYIRTSGQAATGEYTIYNSRTNGLLPAGTYDFGSDGKLFVENSSKNGLIRENGAVYYYENGQLVHKGLIYDEAEGCYYYIRTNGQAATGEYTIYNSRCNGLLSAGTYDFGSDGRLFVK